MSVHDLRVNGDSIATRLQEAEEADRMSQQARMARSMVPCVATQNVERWNVFNVGTPHGAWISLIGSRIGCADGNGDLSMLSAPVVAAQMPLPVALELLRNITSAIQLAAEQGKPKVEV